MTFLRGFFKTAIALFCIWHVVATGIYSLYTVDGYPILEWLDSKRKHVRPYMLVTSQWQRWNLFSPDPLRRVIEMDIEQWKNGGWEPVKILNEHNVGFWQRAPELKIMRRMEGENVGKLRERYVQVLCNTEDLTPGTPMRLTKRWFVVPKHEKTKSKEWWNAWEPNWRADTLLNTQCSENT